MYFLLPRGKSIVFSIGRLLIMIADITLSPTAQPMPTLPLASGETREEDDGDDDDDEKDFGTPSAGVTKGMENTMVTPIPSQLWCTDGARKPRARRS